MTPANLIPLHARVFASLIFHRIPSYQITKQYTMAQKQATRTNQAITLKGSTALVTEFFEYSVNRCVSISSEGSVDS